MKRMNLAIDQSIGKTIKDVKIENDELAIDFLDGKRLWIFDDGQD